MRKFFKLAALAAIAVAFVGCGNEKPGPDSGTGTPSTEYTQDLQFTLELKEVDVDQAKVVVEHNGTTTDSWYGFATTETDIDKAIADALAAGDIKLQKKTRYTVTVKNLEPETDYTFVAVGVTADGKTYGEPATLEFTTKAEVVEVGFTENPNWSLAYTGAQEFQGETYKHTVTVTSTDQNKWFLSSAWLKEEFDAALDEYGIEGILQYELNAFTQFVNYYIEYYKSQGVDVTFADFIYQGTNWDVVDITPGDWYVIAIGVTDNGELSGLYAISDVITIAEEPATEDYLAWIGTWTFTDANGVSLTATFDKDVNNESYLMRGYDAAILADFDYDYPVKVTWLADYGFWTIYPQGPIGTINYTDGSTGELFFLGVQGQSLILDQPLCIGTFDENGNRVVIGYSDENSGINVEYMCHFTVEGEKAYPFENPELIPRFPLVMTAAEAAPTAMAKANDLKTGKKFTTKLVKTGMPIKKFTKYASFKMN